jgi:type I restriction enzyme M protein
MEVEAAWMYSQYQDYVLVVVFPKDVSNKYAGYPNDLINVPPGGSFAGRLNWTGDCV